jgi:hypothetical protein
MSRLALCAALVLAVAACDGVHPWGRSSSTITGNPPVQAMPGGDIAGAEQRHRSADPRFFAPR